MTAHIKEAIALNKTRMPLYAKLTNKASLKFSKKLIRIEKMSLIIAKYVDCKASYFNKKGVKIVAADFVSMENTPQFNEQFDEHIDFTIPFQKVTIKAHKKKIKFFLKQNDFKAIEHSCEKILAELNQSPHLYGMYRHLIESIHRICFLAPLHNNQCQKLNIKSSFPLSKLLVKLHLLIINESYKFDKAIASIQNKGIPFIINDMPKINFEQPY